MSASQLAALCSNLGSEVITKVINTAAKQDG